MFQVAQRVGNFRRRSPNPKNPTERFLSSCKPDETLCCSVSLFSFALPLSHLSFLFLVPPSHALSFPAFPSPSSPTSSHRRGPCLMRLSDPLGTTILLSQGRRQRRTLSLRLGLGRLSGSFLRPTILIGVVIVAATITVSSHPHIRTRQHHHQQQPEGKGEGREGGSHGDHHDGSYHRRRCCPNGWLASSPDALLGGASTSTRASFVLSSLSSLIEALRSCCRFPSTGRARADGHTKSAKSTACKNCNISYQGNQVRRIKDGPLSLYSHLVHTLRLSLFFDPSSDT